MNLFKLKQTHSFSSLACLLSLLLLQSACTTSAEPTTLSGFALSMSAQLSVTPAEITVSPGDRVELSASGGKGPYAYSIQLGPSTIDRDNPNVFIAPDESDITLIRADDPLGGFGTSVITTLAPYRLREKIGYVAASGTYTLKPKGGVPPYTYEIDKPEIGSWDCEEACNTNTFTAPDDLEGHATNKITVIVKDSLEIPLTFTLYINQDPVFEPANATVNINDSFVLVGRYGVPPYTFEITSGEGTLSENIFKAPENAGTTTVKLTDSNGKEATSTITVAASNTFQGLENIDLIGATSMRLNWTHQNSYTHYFIYNTTSGTPVFVSQVSAPLEQYTVTSLLPGNEYTFRVKGYNTNGSFDVLERNVSATTQTIAVTHNGFKHVKALGEFSKASQNEASDLSNSNASVYIEWNAMTPANGAITGYNIYRATTAGAQDFNAAPLGTTATNHYTDTSVTPETNYYYVIKPLVDAVEASASTDSHGHPTEISIYTPPANQVLVHRWIANQSACTLLGKTGFNPSTGMDAQNNYRCMYSGPASTNISGTSFYDIGASILADRNERGCNYTHIGTLGAAIDVGAPALNNIYYNRSTAECSIYDGNNWITANLANSTQLALMSSSKPGIPPLVNIKQSQAALGCSAPTPSQKLMRRKIQLHLSEWSEGLPTIANLETGTDHTVNNSCNTHAANGLTFNDDIGSLVGQDKDTFPATLTAGASYRMLRTGSLSTSACTSKYGAQDTIGNVEEWLSDQISSELGRRSNVDTSNRDFEGIEFDDALKLEARSTSGALSAADLFLNAADRKYNFALGIPMAENASASEYRAIGTDPGEFDPTLFQLDYFSINTGVGGINGLISGGSFDFAGNDGAGRFYLDLTQSKDSPSLERGFRCYREAP